MPNQHTLELFSFISIFLLLIIFRSNFFSFLDKDEKFRNKNIDGLRFFLSIFVVFHHIVFSYNWFHGRGWSIEGYDFNQKIGRFAVAIFFMLSAHLMTRKNLTNTSDVIKFYVNRFFRIVPMAYFSSIICLITALIFGKHIDYSTLIEKLFFWFDGGITDYKPDINRFSGTFLVNAGVMWTLPWEWFLYFCLPVIYVLRDKISGLPVSQFISLIAIYFISKTEYGVACYILCFSFGMTVTDISEKIKLTTSAYSFILCACILIIFLRDCDPISISDIFLEFLLFYCVCNGGDIFGVLKSKGAVRLGEISYSLYLTHGIFLFYFNKLLKNHAVNDSTYLIMLFFVILLSCLFSCVTFIYIEKGGINLGRSISNKYIKKVN